tara:strand:+ start:1776 stop:1973 length:198 start_codon:yes stop_codon:yes gene_type:complete
MQKGDIKMARAKKKRKLSSWNKYVKTKPNQIRFTSGKNKGRLNLKAMAKRYRSITQKPKKSRRKK